MRLLPLFSLAILTGSLITVQSVLNSALGQKTGYLGSVLLLTLVSLSALVVLILLFPQTANFQETPGLSQWYLYLGGLLGVAILAAPIFLIPKIGATSTLTGIVLGQLLLAIIFDHFGLFGLPQMVINLERILGGILLVAGAFLVTR
jgi:transporter family-2 protein